MARCFSELLITHDKCLQIALYTVLTLSGRRVRCGIALGEELK